MPIIGIILTVLGVIAGLAGFIWLLVVAFRESVMQGVGCLLCGPVALVFVVMNLAGFKETVRGWAAGRHSRRNGQSDDWRRAAWRGFSNPIPMRTRTTAQCLCCFTFSVFLWVTKSPRNPWLTIPLQPDDRSTCLSRLRRRWLHGTTRAYPELLETARRRTRRPPLLRLDEEVE